MTEYGKREMPIVETIRRGEEVVYFREYGEDRCLIAALIQLFYLDYLSGI